MICFVPRIMLETKVKKNALLFLLMQSNLAASFKKKVFIVTLAVLVYSFNNQTTTLLWNSSNTTHDALLQCLCLYFLVPAPLNLRGLFFRHR